MANRYASSMPEFLPVVDENGRVIGRALRSECHGNPRLLHPVVHLHVIDRRGRLLLQKRSSRKDLLPGLWDTAVGGHLSMGEEAEQALRRETREELGIDASGAKFLYAYVWKGVHETEYVQSYVLKYDGPFHPDAREVAEVRFFSKKEIEKSKDGMFTPNFLEEYRRLQAHGHF